MKDIVRDMLQSTPTIVFERLWERMRAVEQTLEQDAKIKLLESILSDVVEAERYILHLFIRRLLSGPKIYIGMVKLEEPSDHSIDILSYFYALDYADHPNMKLELPRFVYRTEGKTQWFLRMAANKVNIFGIRREALEKLYDHSCQPVDGDPEGRGVSYSPEKHWPKLLIRIDEESEEKFFTKVDGQIEGNFAPSTMKMLEVAAKMYDQFCVLGFETSRTLELVICSDSIRALEAVIKRVKQDQKLPKKAKILTKGMRNLIQARAELRGTQKVPEHIRIAKFIHVSSVKEMINKMLTGKFLELNKRRASKVEYHIEKKEDYIAHYELGVNRYFVTAAGERIPFSQYLSKVDLKTLANKIGEPIWVIQFGNKIYGKKR